MLDNSREVSEMGDFDVGIFLLLVLVALEGMAEESRLILVVVTPFRTKDVEAKQEQYELFSTEIDVCLFVLRFYGPVNPPRLTYLG